MKQALIAAAVCVAALAGVAPAPAAPAYPAGPVHLVVPFPAGGPTDTLARLLAEGLQAQWGQPVIVENKPGAGTLIGADYVAKAAPDGQTMGMVISAYTINPSVRRSMPYDTLRDLQGVTQLAESKLALVARADAPFDTVPELIELARRQPAKLTYASPGAGTSTHLAGELFKHAAGVDIVHVPYKGSSPAQTDLIGGQVDLMFDLLQSALPMVRSGRLKIIALASPQRDPAFPDYPTVGETLDGFEVGSMFGLVAPAGTPTDKLQAIRDAAAQVIQSPKVAQAMTDLGMTPVVSTPAAFDRFLRDEIDKWREVAQQSNVRID
ncbi:MULTISPECIES: tripartite tricarboxylate transporter substrate binding protein [Bordetella]|uniref:MFS transporter n=1 Tax=Bordetella genomosp. 2 TaxID=1983456 RepID=A0A261VI94_9BORD|nr:MULTISPECIES: tripartite tricarboxylate transporter substrate binding protein [Bordetella]OZI73785.1 MFS transporter [Bordetella genomosp. 2]